MSGQTAEYVSAGFRHGHDHMWCEGCDEDCIFGPCCVPDGSLRRMHEAARTDGSGCADGD